MTNNTKYDAFFEDAEEETPSIEDILHGEEGLVVGDGALRRIIDELPDGLPEGVRDALVVTERVGTYERNVLKAIYAGTRMEHASNAVMQDVAMRLGVTPADFPAGGYARHCLEHATADELVAFSQAMTNAFDLILLAFTEAYRIVDIVLNNEKVTVRIGPGELHSTQSDRADALLTIQPKRDATRASIIAGGMVALEQQFEQGNIPNHEVFQMALKALIAHANSEAMKIPLDGVDDGDTAETAQEDGASA